MKEKISTAICKGEIIEDCIDMEYIILITVIQLNDEGKYRSVKVSEELRAFLRDLGILETQEGVYESQIIDDTELIMKYLLENKKGFEFLRDDSLAKVMIRSLEEERDG
jgi:hypothetical protein